MSGSVLDTNDILVNNRDIVPVIMELKSKGEVQINKKKIIYCNRYFDSESSGWHEPIRTPNPTLGGGWREICGNHVIQS